MRDRNSVTVALMLSVGSRYEDAGHAGISHFIEHLCFKGSSRWPDSRAIAEAIEGVGGILNASTDKESTLYYAKVPANRLELAVDVLGDLVFHPRVDAEELERERRVIIEEIRMYEDMPQEHVHSLFEQCVWPDSPLGRDIAGTVDSVTNLTRDMVQDYMRRHYRASRLVVALAGAVDRDDAAAIIERRVAASGDGIGEPDQAGESNGETRMILRTRRTEQTHICLGAGSCSFNDPRRYQEEIVNTILGEGMSSRLFLEVREKLGLAYDVHSFMTKYADTGLFGVYAGVEHGKVRVALEAILTELHRLATETVSEEELTKAREYYKGRLLLGLESTNGMAAWLGGQELMMGRIRQPAEVIREVDRITAEQVRITAARLFTEQPLRMAVIGPQRAEAPLLRMINRQ
ncbi:MAG: M16 family metallopeptidase [Candidatus Dormibacteria bacterium]